MRRIDLNVPHPNGPRCIRAAHLVVLGLGGLGMPLVQQLAHFGVGRFAVADSDLVRAGDLDHLVGASVDDVGLYKVIVAERLIRGLRPNAEVTALMVDLPHDSIADAVTGATVVVGCFDHETPRLLATKLCSAAGVPYVDVATQAGILRGRPVYGGRVIVAADGTGCVSCLDVPDRGQDRLLPGAPPLPVAMNGVVGSLAAMEIMCLLTGVRRPARQLTYSGERGSVQRVRRPGRAGCPYCARWRRGAGPSRRE